MTTAEAEVHVVQLSRQDSWSAGQPRALSVHAVTMSLLDVEFCVNQLPEPPPPNPPPPPPPLTLPSSQSCRDAVVTEYPVLRWSAVLPPPLPLPPPPTLLPPPNVVDVCILLQSPQDVQFIAGQLALPPLWSMWSCHYRNGMSSCLSTRLSSTAVNVQIRMPSPHNIQLPRGQLALCSCKRRIVTLLP